MGAEGKENLYTYYLGYCCKDIIEVFAMVLSEAFGNKSGLIATIMFDLKHPLQ